MNQQKKKKKNICLVNIPELQFDKWAWDYSPRSAEGPLEVGYALWRVTSQRAFVL